MGKVCLETAHADGDTDLLIVQIGICNWMTK